MTKPLRWTCAVIVLPFLSATLSADPPTRASGDRVLKARSVLKRFCSECHADKPEQPSGLNLMDHADALSENRPIPAVNRTAKDRSLIVQWMTDGSMPPYGRDGTRRRPTPDDIVAVKAWIDDEARSYPAEYDDRYVADAILADAKTRSVEDRTNDRYFTFQQLVQDGLPWPNLAERFARTSTALERASVGGQGKLNAVTLAADPAAVVFRYDLRSLGWDNRDPFENVVIGASGRESREGTAGITVQDLLVLESPDAPPNVDAATQRALSQWVLEPQKLLRPLPSLRGEWLAEVLAADADLTREIQAVVALTAKLNSELPALVVRFSESIPRESQTMPSLESLIGLRDRTNSMVDRFQITLQQPIGKKTGRVTAGEPFILSADNFDKSTKQLRALHVDRGGVVTPQSLSPASFDYGSNQKVTPSIANKVGFVRPFKDDAATKPIESFVLFISKEALPELRVFRSRHSGDRQAYRFHFVRKSLWDDEARLMTAARYVLRYTIVDPARKGP